MMKQKKKKCGNNYSPEKIHVSRICENNYSLERYTSPEERQQIIDELRLVPKKYV